MKAVAPLQRSAEAAPRQAPRRHSDLRIFVCRVIEGIARVCFGRALYRRFYLAEGRFDVRRERVEVPDLSAGLHGFTIAQISDIHAGTFVGEGDLEHVVAAVRRAQPDLCVLTGDFINHVWNDALLVLDDLAELVSTHGTFAVFGNHDYHGRHEGHIAAAYASRGIHFLRNECQRFETGDGALALIGLEDLEEAREVDLEGPRAEVEPGDVEVVLCHNPGGAEAIAREQCAVILSGHTHGGQVCLPGLRDLGPPHPGDRRTFGSTIAITNRGVGVVVAPLRIGARPEVVLVELVPAEECP